MGKSSPKIKESVFSIEKDSNTTVFSNPKDNHRETEKKKKKWIPFVIISLVLVLVVLPFVAKLLANDGSAVNNVKPISKRSLIVKDEHISDKAKVLFESINKDPLNIKATQHISGLLGVTTYCGAHEILVYEDPDSSGGYTLCFAFERGHSTSTESAFHNLMIDYAVAFMALVDNISSVEWTCPSIDGVGEAKSEKITFDDIKRYLNDSPKEYAKSVKTVQFMLNEHSLNDLSD